MKAYTVERHSFSFPQEDRIIAYFKTRELAKQYMIKTVKERGVHIYKNREDFFAENRDNIKILPRKMLGNQTLEDVFFKNSFQYVIAHYVKEITIND